MNWFRPQLRVLFVCTANVCRSPLAEAMLRQRLRALNLADKVQVRSAGTCASQHGRRPDARIEKLAAQAGIALGRIRSRLLTPKMIERSDYVLVMEQRHLDDVALLFAVSHGANTDVADVAISDKTFIPRKTLPQNVQLLGSYLPRRNTAVNDIPDPYFGDWQGFNDIYELIDSALDNLSTDIEKRLGISRDL